MFDDCTNFDGLFLYPVVTQNTNKMSNMFEEKNKGKSTPKPPPKEKIRISSYFSKLVQAYSEDEAKRATIMDAWQQKKPKSYGLLYYPFYRFSTMSLTILHLISFMCAVSIVGYLMTLDIGNTAYILSGLSVLVLILCEFGQHSTLNLGFNLYHQTNSVPQSIIFICLVFSLVSVASSAFGTYNFSQTYGESTIVYMLIFISILNEILIMYCTFYIHNYQKNAYNESHLINDLYMGNEANLFFDFLPKIKRMQTHMANVPMMPEMNQQPQIILQPQNDSTGATGAKKMPTKKGTNKKQKTAVKPIRTPHSDENDTWNKTDVNTFLREYKTRAKKRTDKGKKPTIDQQKNLDFFNEILRTHDFRKGNFPKVEPDDRTDYFSNLKNDVI